MSERDDALEEAARLIESDGVNITSPQLLQLLASQARGIRLLKGQRPAETFVDPMTSRSIEKLMTEVCPHGVAGTAFCMTCTPYERPDAPEKHHG